jgi:two-component sensor histidine kinase
MVGELRHRMKNLITVIDALAKNSRRRAESTSGVEEFLKRFLGRLHALAAAADLLLATNREAIDANAVVRATLVPFDEEKSSRIRISGRICSFPRIWAADWRSRSTSLPPTRSNTAHCP